jgi:hypothetical protein
VIPAFVQDVLVAIIVGAAVVALVMRFVAHRRVRRCPSCPAESSRPSGPVRPARAALGRAIRAKGLDVVS